MAAPVIDYAEVIVDNLDGRDWIISNAIMDSNIALAAHEKKVELQVLRPKLARTGAYLSYLSTLFEEPRLKAMARIGLIPFLNEWLRLDPEAHKRIASLTNADMWQAAGFESVAGKVAFMGAEKVEPDHARKVYADHQAFWEEMVPKLEAMPLWDPQLRTYFVWMKIHQSKLANNLGVTLADGGFERAALSCYQQSETIFTNNISALLNQFHVFDQYQDESKSRELLGRVAKIQENKETKLSSWFLAKQYGYVRNPELIARRGFAWAMSGKPGVALTEINRAMKMNQDPSDLQYFLASMLLLQNQDQSTEQMYLNLLRAIPKDKTALMGLALVSMNKGDFDSARSYLGRLKELKVSPNLIQYEEAKLAMLEGKHEEAKALLLELVNNQSKNIRAWIMLAMVDLQQGGDKKLAKRVMDRLSGFDIKNPQMLLAMGRVYAALPDLENAYKLLERVVALQPGSREALEVMLKLDMTKSRRDLAVKHAEKLIALDPQNYLANRVLGDIQLFEGNYAIAESFYRTSIESRPTSDPLNSLAWLMQFNRKAEEGLQYAERALALDATKTESWHTMALIQFRLGKLNEAQQSLERALAIRNDNFYARLYMALLFDKRGMKEEALELLDEVLQYQGIFLPEVYDEGKEVQQRLRRGTTGDSVVQN